MKLEKIVSGGQSGADQAGWRAARAFGLSSGGWMPRGFLTEEGPRLEFAELYAAEEMPTEIPRDRTQRNALESDATVWFGVTTTSGAQETVGACHRFGKPCLPVTPDASFDPSYVAAWIAENKIATLNVAGNRESDEPGIGERVERFLGEVLQLLENDQRLTRFRSYFQEAVHLGAKCSPDRHPQLPPLHSPTGSTSTSGCGTC
jgi:hypothetical protein